MPPCACALSASSSIVRLWGDLTPAWETAVAAAIDKAIHDVLASGQIKSLAAGKMGMGTREVGDLIAKMVS
jgi:hypothetical protein